MNFQRAFGLARLVCIVVGAAVILGWCSGRIDRAHLGPRTTFTPAPTCTTTHRNELGRCAYHPASP